MKWWFGEVHCQAKCTLEYLVINECRKWSKININTSFFYRLETNESVGLILSVATNTLSLSMMVHFTIKAINEADKKYQRFDSDKTVNCIYKGNAKLVFWSYN